MNRHASMNRIYRLVWSRVRNAWVPVAENAPGRGKGGRARTASRGRADAAVSFLLLASGVLLGLTAHAGPTGGQVTAGAGSITHAGSTTTIKQSSQNLSIDWLGFNIAPQETVDFLQPSSAAVAVNRILGSNGTQILGHLDANGQVYLINPNGIVFGKGAQVNVGGLVASTLDLGSSGTGGITQTFGAVDMLRGGAAGGSSDSAVGAGSVVNEGTINATGGGYVALIGNHVSNQGMISAQLGTVALAAGSVVTLTFNGESLAHLEVDRSVLRSLAQNGGLIQADGGRVLMTAGARDAVLASVVNNTGLIEARTVQNHAGSITLLGGMSAGTVTVGGTLDASAPGGGSGGSIETSAAHVEVADSAKVTTTAAEGLYGSWLIDPQDFTVAGSGGDITGAALVAQLNSTSVTLESSKGAKAGAGNVNVDSALSWSADTRLTLIASNNVDVNASITATGATAGLVIDPNTANGTAAASGTGTFNLAAGAAINLPNVSPTSTTALVIGGTTYRVLNKLGAAGSTTGTDLQGILGDLGGHFALGSNLDATATASWNAGAGFAPLGTAATSFTGLFDGLGHSIANLTIDRPTIGDVGLFGAIGAGSEVRNVGLIGGSVHGGVGVGALVGSSYGGTVSNSHAAARVSGGNEVGGLVGVNSDDPLVTPQISTIDRSDATGIVSGSNDVGGLVGYNLGNVTRSYATGKVSGANYVGGLAGFNEGNYQYIGTISGSHATGTVTGVDNVGGLVGGNAGGYGGAVANSYATGNVSGSGNIGGLVGFTGGAATYGSSGATVGSISNSYATGNVGGSSGNVGGLVGLNWGSVANSHASGSVDGLGAVGGLVGYNGGPNANYRTGATLGWITESYATGAVNGSSNVGGLVGYTGGGNGTYGSTGAIVDSYATGRVSGSGNVGGLVGYNSTYGTVITNSYAVGSVSGGAAVGGLVGNNQTAGSVTDSYWNTTTSGQSSSAGGSGLTTDQMHSTSSFTGFNFTATPGAAGNNWVIVDGDGTLNNAGGAPGGTSPMLASEYSTSISNAHQLQLMAMNTAARYTLQQNIDASATTAGTDVWDAAGFAPIGRSAAPFTGTFDGAGHSIGNLTVNAVYQNEVGLFGETGATAAIRNVGLVGGAVTGAAYTGGLAGINGGIISNSYSTAAVRGAGNNGQLGYGFVGGLAGKNTGTISNSYATGAVSGANDVGGLVGDNSGVIAASHATGYVDAIIDIDSSFGALGGLVGANSGTISGSHATGTVIGGSYSLDNAGAVGGLVGANLAGSITHSFATGGAYNSYGDVGGLVGTNDGTIANSRASGGASGGGSHIGAGVAGGLVGTNNGTISNSHATGGVTGSSFVLDPSGRYGFAGGLVGRNYGTVSKSYATGSVGGSGYVGGGLAGFNVGVVDHSYATGRVNGNFNYGGGLAGAGTGSINDSYSTGNVSAYTAGGLVGFNQGIVTDAYATGAVSATILSGGLAAVNFGTVNHSFWNLTTSGQSSSAGGLGMTTAQMQTQANFTSATAANGNVNPAWDFATTWVMYNGHTYPLLASFMTPLTVTATGLTKTYTGSAFSGGNGVTYSVAPAGNLFGTASYGGSSQGAVNVGTYVITPGGLYSDQQGYIIHYVSGALTVKQLPSVAWIGGTSGDWSKPSNWAGGAIPDYANVAAVTIPSGDTVTYDSGVPGRTELTSLTSAGKLIMTAGTLSTSGNLSTAGFDQSGGTLDVGGVFTVKSTNGAVSLGNITAGVLDVGSTAGAITELSGAPIDVTGASTLSADNGLTGTADKRYAISLANTADKLVGAVTAKGSAITLADKAALTATLNATGAASLTAAGALQVTGMVATNLTTVTTGGTGSPTTFGATTVGNNLKVTSTGAVTKTTTTTALEVDGAGTNTSNPDVTVNGVVGAVIK